MLVVDKDVSLMVTGLGDVIEPPDGVMAIGSGGGFALGTFALVTAVRILNIFCFYFGNTSCCESPLRLRAQRNGHLQAVHEHCSRDVRVHKLQFRM